MESEEAITLTNTTGQRKQKMNVRGSTEEKAKDRLKKMQTRVKGTNSKKSNPSSKKKKQTVCSEKPNLITLQAQA